jgi:hypothetical protein
LIWPLKHLLGLLDDDDVLLDDDDDVLLEISVRSPSNKPG